jgi:hypothetical protein
MRLRSTLNVLGLVPPIACTSSGAIHARPRLLFPYQLSVGAVALPAREPPPPNAEACWPASISGWPPRRCSSRHHDGYLCGAPALYAFLSPRHPDTGGERYVSLGNATFLRPGREADDRRLAPSGEPAPGARTLTSFITHEGPRAHRRRAGGAPLPPPRALASARADASPRLAPLRRAAPCTTASPRRGGLARPEAVPPGGGDARPRRGPTPRGGKRTQVVPFAARRLVAPAPLAPARWAVAREPWGSTRVPVSVEALSE